LSERDERDEIKVAPPIARKFLDIKAIRLYPKIDGFVRNVNSTVERGEKPQLLLKAAYSPRRLDYEIEIACLGRYHVERLEYWKKNPEDWLSFGEFVFSPDQGRELAETLKYLHSVIPSREVKASEPKDVQTTLGSAMTSFQLGRALYGIEVANLLSLFEPKLSQIMKRARQD
jgi:hypothetical protein